MCPLLKKEEIREKSPLKDCKTAKAISGLKFVKKSGVKDLGTISIISDIDK